MKAKCLFLFSLMLAFAGCPSPITQTESYPVTFNVTDKDSGTSLSDLSLIIPESAINAQYSTGQFTVQVKAGKYTFCLIKQGFTAAGYVIDVRSNKTINARLSPTAPSPSSYEMVSGTVQNNGAAFTDPFYICTSPDNRRDSSISQLPLSDPNGHFDFTSACGNISISAFTVAGSHVQTIAYVKNQPLSQGSPLSGVVLDFNTSLIGFSGTKPTDSDLSVLLNGNFLIGREDISDGSYSFSADISGGDTVTLESFKADVSGNYFLKKSVGGSGGNNDLYFSIPLPAFSLATQPNYYEATINPVSGATYYELVVEETVSGETYLAYQAACLSGTAIKIPKAALSSSASSTCVFVDAVQYPDFNQQEVLLGTANFSSYTYSETNQVLVKSGLEFSKSRAIHNRRLMLE